MKWLRPKPSKKAIAALAAVVAAEVAAGAGLFIQQRAALARATVVLEDRKAQRDEGTRLASRLAMKEEELAHQTGRLKFLEAGIPSSAYVPTLLRQLEALARSTDNRVRGVRPSVEQSPPRTKMQKRTDPEADEKATKNVPEAAPKAAEEPFQRLRIQVNLTGTYPSSQRFIQQLTQFPKILAVNGMTLRPRTNEDGKNGHEMLDIELNITAFVMKDGPIQTGMPAQSAPAGSQEI